MDKIIAFLSNATHELKATTEHVWDALLQKNPHNTRLSWDKCKSFFTLPQDARSAILLHLYDQSFRTCPSVSEMFRSNGVEHESVKLWDMVEGEFIRLWYAKKEPQDIVLNENRAIVLKKGGALEMLFLYGNEESIGYWCKKIPRHTPSPPVPPEGVNWLHATTHHHGPSRVLARRLESGAYAPRLLEIIYSSPFASLALWALHERLVECLQNARCADLSLWDEITNLLPSNLNPLSAMVQSTKAKIVLQRFIGVRLSTESQKYWKI